MKALVALLSAALFIAAAYSQTVTLATPAPEEYPKRGFDGSDKLKVTGKVEKIDTLGGKSILWISAQKVVKTGFGVRPGTEAEGVGMLWRVEGSSVAQIKDTPAVGAIITITGDNSDDKTCMPTCRIKASKVEMS